MQTLYWVEQSLDADLVQHKGDRSAAKEAIAKATAIRGKDAAAFAKTEANLDTNIAALAKAIPAIEKGMGGFLQTSAAQVVKQLSINMIMSGVDREMLTNFMESKTGNAPASGEIVGILKTMNDEMTADLKDATDSHQPDALLHPCNTNTTLRCTLATTTRLYVAPLQHQHDANQHHSGQCMIPRADIVFRTGRAFRRSIA